MRLRDVFTRLREKSAPKLKKAAKIVYRTGFEPVKAAAAAALFFSISSLLTVLRERPEFSGPLWGVMAFGLGVAAFLHALDRTVAVIPLSAVIFIASMVAAYFGAGIWLRPELYPGFARQAILFSTSTTMVYVSLCLFFWRWEPVERLRGRIETIEDLVPREAPAPQPAPQPAGPGVIARIRAAVARACAALSAAPPAGSARPRRRAREGLI
mgnify:CR=1 FL=1